MFFKTKKRIEELNSDIYQLRSFLERKYSEIGDELSSIWNEVDKQEIDMLTLENRSDRLSEDADSFEERVIELEKENEVVKEILSELKDENRVLRGNLEIAFNEITNLTKAVDELKRKLAQPVAEEKNNRESQIVKDMQAIQRFSLDDAFAFIMGEK